MANIHITHDYTMPADELKTKLDTLASEMSSRYQLQCSWSGEDCMKFKRNGASGEIKINDGHLALSMKLGLMLGAFKPMIEKDIQKFVVENIR